MTDRPAPADAQRGPRVALIHGFLAGEHMRRHLLHFVRNNGAPGATLYGHLHPVRAMADDLQAAAEAGRAIAFVGYSQGGFHALKAARELEQRNVGVPLLVMMAAGGLGRWLPAQWGFDPRKLPGNVAHCINYFSVGDALGSDRRVEDNLVRPARGGQKVENIAFAREEKISHTGLSRCYPAERVHPQVRDLLLQRLRSELARLAAASPR